MVRGRAGGDKPTVTLTANDLDKLTTNNIPITDDSHKHTCCTVNEKGEYGM